MTPKRRNILLAYDGSQHAQAAVEYLLITPHPPNSRIFILRAFSPGQVDYLTGFEKALQGIKEQLEEKGFKVDTDLQLGSAAEKIVETAQIRKPDLIVLGAKGLRATLGILLGGVAQQVVEYACCPVLIIRAPCESLGRVLFVTDGSRHSQDTARYLAKFPLPQNVDMRVMHVLPPVQQPIMMDPLLGSWQTTYSTYETAEVDKTLLERQKKEGEVLLGKASGLLRRHGLTPTPVLLRGDAATEIIDYVKTEKIDLIVAGSRGLGQIKSWWMGSVSRKLVHYAPCSVLIVKGPKKEQAGGS